MQECDICCHPFQEKDRTARMLPCGHTFCEQCLKKLHADGQITCNDCCTEHRVESVDCFAVNYLAYRSIDPEVVQPAGPGVDTGPQQERQGKRRRKVDAMKEEQSASLLNTKSIGMEKIQTLVKYCSSIEDDSVHLDKLVDVFHALVELTQHSRAGLVLETEKVAKSCNTGELLYKEIDKIHLKLSEATTPERIVEAVDEGDSQIEAAEDWINQCGLAHPDVSTIHLAAKLRNVFTQGLREMIRSINIGELQLPHAAKTLSDFMVRDDLVQDDPYQGGLAQSDPSHADLGQVDGAQDGLAQDGGARHDMTHRGSSEVNTAVKKKQKKKKKQQPPVKVTVKVSSAGRGPGGKSPDGRVDVCCVPPQTSSPLHPGLSPLQPPVAIPPAGPPLPLPCCTGGQPDYSAQWANYYRCMGMHREAEAIEEQAKAMKVAGPASSAALQQGDRGPGTPVAGTACGTGTPLAGAAGGTGAPVAAATGGTGPPVAAATGGTGAPVAGAGGGTGAPDYPGYNVLYYQQWRDYYRAQGMHAEADKMEAQIRASKGGTVGAPAFFIAPHQLGGPPAPTSIPVNGQVTPQQTGAWMTSYYHHWIQHYRSAGMHTSADEIEQQLKKWTI